MRDAYVATNVDKFIVQNLVSYIGTIYTRQNQYAPLNLFVDEFYSVVYEGYTDIFNKSRAAGLRVFVGLQTTADIAAKVSDVVRRQMYGLIANKIYMRIPDAEQAQERVATLGTCQIPKRTVTRNVAYNLDVDERGTCLRRMRGLLGKPSQAQTVTAASATSSTRFLIGRPHRSDKSKKRCQINGF